MSGAAPSRDAELLHAGCEELGLSLSQQQSGQLLAYLDLLYVWNRSAGLTTIPRKEAVRLHLLDSLAAAEAWRKGPCLDIGAGGGLPGLVLAVARPAEPFVLVESNRRKCSFLSEAVRRTGLSNVRVVESDYERFAPEQPFPTVVSRAFRPPSEFLSIAKRFVASDADIVLLLADPPESELTDLAARAGLRLAACRRLHLPGEGEPRAVVTFRTA